MFCLSHVKKHKHTLCILFVQLNIEQIFSAHVSAKEKLDGECSGKIAFTDHEGAGADAGLIDPLENASCDVQNREARMHEPVKDTSGPTGEWITMSMFYRYPFKCIQSNFSGGRGFLYSVCLVSRWLDFVFIFLIFLNQQYCFNNFYYCRRIHLAFVNPCAVCAPYNVDLARERSM